MWVGILQITWYTSIYSLQNRDFINSFHYQKYNNNWCVHVKVVYIENKNLKANN